MRVVLLSLDGFNPDAVGPDLTPNLWALAATGGIAPEGGRCDLPSVTYPCHATMLTGRRAAGHGVVSNLAGSPRPGTVPGWAGEAQVRAPSIFSLLREAGVRSAAVFGDQHIHDIARGGDADHAWPPAGRLPHGVPVDANGYATNAAVRPLLLAHAADRDLPFLFAHLNETDTWGHRHGPAAPETRDAYRATDAIIGEMMEALRPDWDETVVVVLSDHGMEALGDEPTVDLRRGAPGIADIVSDVVAEGGSALVRLRPGVSPERATDLLARVPGVVAATAIADDVVLVSGAPGVLFGSGPVKGLRGFHGGPGTTVTTAVVGGGHPAAGRIGAALRETPPHLADWVPTIAGLLGVVVPETDGRDLLA